MPSATPRSVAPRQPGWLLTLVAVMLCGGLVVSAPSAAKDAGPALDEYTPVTGVMFNDPTGDDLAKNRLITHIIRTINSTPSGSSIKMAVYSFAHPAVADALMAAHARGVRLKLVFSGGRVFDAMRRLQRAVGSDASAKSFAIFCNRSCRGTSGEMHAKYFAFREAGQAQWVTMVGSVNLTRYNAERQWNDIYTVVNDAAYFRAYTRWFAQLKRDTPLTTTYVSRTLPLVDVSFTPMDPTLTPDPILGALNQIRCQVPMGEIDPASPTPDVLVATQLMIAAHAWNGPRGKLLAHKVAELSGVFGCQVRVIVGVGTGAAVRSILAGGGVSVTAGVHPGIRTHQKMMVVSGGFGTDPQMIRAWTGSSNWSSRALPRDDVIVQIKDEAVAADYVDNFEFMWLYG
jgi:phosphatidylserine/phosphatidylglycerophosphate/cardiolipin synthase-like enzyme